MTGRPKAGWGRSLNRSLLAWLVVAILVSAGGCGSGNQPASPQSAGFPLTVTDSGGRSVTVSSEPQRIVSLAPSHTEILFALELGDKVVGVDKFSNYPPEAEKIEKVGGFSDPSLEKIASLQPDLVLGTGLHKKLLPQLESLGAAVLLLESRDVEGALAHIQLVGRVTDRSRVAEQVVAEIRVRLERIKSKVQTVPQEQRPWVYYEVYSEPIMTVGPHTLIHQLIEWAGGRNIAYDAQTDYPEFSAEAVIQRNPEVIIFPSFHGTASLTVEKLRARPGWGSIRAVKEGRVYPIDADLISRPGPRLAEAAEELARLILPQHFPR